MESTKGSKKSGWLVLGRTGTGNGAYVARDHVIACFKSQRAAENKVETERRRSVAQTGYSYYQIRQGSAL